MTQVCVGVLFAVLAGPGLARRASADAVPAAAVRDVSGESPQSAMRGFLGAARSGDWSTAASFLDLRHLRPREREESGVELSHRVKWVLDRTLWVELELLSDEVAGDGDDGLPRAHERVGTVDTEQGRLDVLLVRTPGSAPSWRISAATVAQLDGLYESLGGGRLAQVLPAVFFEYQLLEVLLWQWLGLLAIAVLAIFGAWLALHLVVWIVSSSRGAIRLERGRSLREALGPIRLLVAIGIFALCLPALMLAVPARDFVGALERTLTIGAFAWLVARLASNAGQRIEARLREQGKFAAIALVPLARRAVLFVLGAITLLAALQNLGINVTGILAGLGVGGLAVALAAQKTVENLFGGLTLVADQPVRVGDFCRFGDQLGTIEDIGLRSTRVRTLDRTLVSVPNAEFSALQLESFSARDRILFRHTLGLRYETEPEQLRQVLAALRELLRAHPRVHPDPARVRFVRFGSYSLDLEVFAYVTTCDYDEYLEIAEELLLRIAESVGANGAEFAFPSQTVYLDGNAAPASDPRGLSARAA